MVVEFANDVGKRRGPNRPAAGDSWWCPDSIGPACCSKSGDQSARRHPVELGAGYEADSIGLRPVYPHRGRQSTQGYRGLRGNRSIHEARFGHHRPQNEGPASRRRAHHLHRDVRVPIRARQPDHQGFRFENRTVEPGQLPALPARDESPGRQGTLRIDARQGR